MESDTVEIWMWTTHQSSGAYMYSMGLGPSFVGTTAATRSVRTAIMGRKESLGALT